MGLGAVTSRVRPRFMDQAKAPTLGPDAVHGTCEVNQLSGRSIHISHTSNFDNRWG